VLVQAGDRARGLNAFAVAVTYYERAIELLGKYNQQRPQLLFRHAEAAFRSGSPDRDSLLEHARDALLTTGDNDAAAEAESMLAEVWWLRGDRDRCTAHVEAAVALVSDRAASPAKAGVLAQTARFTMLAGMYEEAIRLGQDALAMSDALAIDELRAQALITIGSARGLSGEVGGISDIERGIEIALASNHQHAASRGYMNLASQTRDRDSEKAAEFVSVAADISRSLGDHESARYPTIMLADYLFESGEWDEALRIAESPPSAQHTISTARRCRDADRERDERDAVGFCCGSGFPPRHWGPLASIFSLVGKRKGWWAGSGC
jgi:tetratricopeptide (TPR) repeat protein